MRFVEHRCVLRFGMVLGLVLAKFGMLAQSPHAFRAEDGINFIREKPFFHEVLFEYIIDGFGPSFSGDIEGKSKNLVFLRWQPGAYYVQSLEDIDDIDTPRLDLVAAGRFRSEIWEIHGGALTVFDSLVNTNDFALSVLGADLVSRRQIEIVRNLGLKEINDDSVLEWSEKKLVIKNPGKTVRVARFLENSDGLLTKIELFTEPKGARYGSIMFRYADSSAFPAGVDRYYWNANKEESLMFTMNFVRFETGDKLLPVEMFDPRKFIDVTKVGSQYFYSNNVSYAVSPLPGRLPQRVRGKGEPELTPRDRSTFDFMILLLCVFLAVPVFWVLARSVRERVM